MMMKRVVLRVLPVLLVLTLAVPAAARAQSQPSKPAATDEFVPVTNPSVTQETIPAARLVAVAYGFIWVVLLGYVWSVRSRLSRVEREIEAVSRRVPERK
jgi:CcmD family protein